MPQHPRKPGRDRAQPLHRHADSPVVHRTHPRRRARDIREGLIRIENYDDGLCRREIQLGLDPLEILLECSQDFFCQLGGCSTMKSKHEVAAFSLPIARLHTQFTSRLFKSQLHLHIRSQPQRTLPFFRGLLGTVLSVIRPARQLGNLR